MTASTRKVIRSLQARRRSSWITLHELSMETGISLDRLHEMEHGFYSPPKRRLQMIDRALEAIARRSRFGDGNWGLEILRKRRLESRITLEELAMYIGISVSRLNNIERGLAKAKDQDIEMAHRALTQAITVHLERLRKLIGADGIKDKL